MTNVRILGSRSDRFINIPSTEIMVIMLVICKHLGEVIKVMREQKVTLYLPISKLECKQCDYRWNEEMTD